MSSTRVLQRSRSATWLSSRSPASWPRASLTALKRSMFRCTSPTCSPAAAGERDGVPQPVGQRPAVGQPGQRVGEGAADQVVLGAAPVGDVDQREDDELRLAVVVAHDLVRLDHPQLGAVGRGAAGARRRAAGSGRGARRARASRPRSPTGGSSGWASRSTWRPASSSAVRPVRAHIIGFATSTCPSRSTIALGIGAERNSAWNSWPRSASRVSMARMRCPAGRRGYRRVSAAPRRRGCSPVTGSPIGAAK